MIAITIKANDKHLVLLGGLLPDVAWVGMYLVSIFDVDPMTTYPYFLSLHTPFIALLLSSSIASVSSQPKKSFSLLAIGAMSHITLDLLQKGHRQLLLYPLTYDQLSYGLFWQEDFMGVGLSALSILILIIYLIRYNHEKATIFFGFTNKNNMTIALILLLLAFTIPLSTENFVNDNTGYSKFVQDSNFKNDVAVDLFNLPVVVIDNRPYITIYGKYFEILTEKKLKTGDCVSIKGIYNNGTIQTSYLHTHNTLSKPLFSSIGGLLFTLIWIRRYI
ncbi:hypothetical protein FHEFKHOI_01389 [Candidatus Methanoperedenaceae archaeon GB50]|nr:MAG: hypothetical protein KBONHNOK_00333 [Candidatus Methanoperedenaceae archaeon GB50]CAD7773298.1 hypothetical protein AIOGIFDO_01384 [Candidatus Methanoperedenaceae archaeon GB37]CAD7773396.1 hypothetical protein FHEFKHOI_01389 [Candidatus Methanoperedenaceae archaeon GB50]